MNDTIWILILPGAMTSSYVIILRTFIVQSIPDALFEAARIDGASNFRVFGQIVLPLFKPGLATIGLFSVVSRWNEWFTGMLYIQQNKDLTPLQTVLQRIQSNMEFLKNQAAKGMLTPEQAEAYNKMPTEAFRMAVTVVATLPILFAYPFFQRYFIEGLTIGSVKG
jgi:putative aldouronate transport system permease protein